MKKRAVLISTILTVAVCTACGNKAPKEWYKDTIAYYQDGISKGWDKVEPEDYKLTGAVKVEAYVVGADGKKSTSGVTVTDGTDSGDKLGYLLKDLDGDGVDELLIGLINDAPQTQFSDVIVWNSDLGATHVMGGSSDHYIYLYNDGTLISESFFGGTMDAMKYSSEDNAFVDAGTGSLTSAGKFELTPFQ